MKKFYGTLLLLFAFQFSWSQVVINSTGSAYTQNFNLLAQTGTANTWTDNTTITGWYSTQTTYRAESGSGATGALYSYGASVAPGDLTDRALGLLSSGSSTFRFAVQIKNTTGSAVSSFSVAFTGEEWRQNATAQKLVFEYSTDATTLSSGTWTALTALDFTAPIAGSTGALDGNATANRIALSATVAASVADNGTIWFRWSKAGSNSPGLAIDDISITANGGVAVNSITTGAVSTSPFCVNASTAATGTASYTATGTYNTTFTAYLSDASGSFAAPVSIGSTTVNGTDPSGSINITIPAGTTSGTGYKIRVDALAPAVTGSASTAFEIVNGAKNVTGASAASANAQATVSWTNPNACFDEVLIVAKASASVAATPTGDGSAYTASNTFGSGTAFDGGFVVYKGSASPQTVTGLTNGTLYFFKLFTRKGTNWSTGIEVSATPSLQVSVSPGDIVINQLSPQYSTVNDEYIELVNKTDSPIDLSGFTIRYQSAAGNPTTGNLLATLSGTLLPKRYWLLSPNATVNVGQTNSVASDGIYSAGMATAAGQIALIHNGVIIDAVGYGTVSGGTYYETASAPATPANGGIKRSPNGADNDNNSTDFVTVANAAIFLRSSSVGSPLQVKLINLKAVQRGAAVHISWSNATESGILDYTVERSVNSVDFTTLSKIAPTSNLQNQADYLTIDASPLKGNNYYRIRSTETNGKITFSNILNLNTVGTAARLLVYPNPIKGGEGTMQLSNIPAGRYSVQVLNAEGRILSLQTLSFTEGSSTETFPANKLPAGFYILQVNGPRRFLQSFVKE